MKIIQSVPLGCTIFGAPLYTLLFEIKHPVYYSVFGLLVENSGHFVNHTFIVDRFGISFRSFFYYLTFAA